MADTVSIQGHADGRFVGVADAFRTSLSGDDLGAAVCVVRDGMVVVDLWTGVRDGSSRAPWLRATPVPLFSTGKGPVALAALLSVARGDIALDEPVAARWPAFAANGKAGITLRHILDHSSGLVLFGRRMDRRMLADPVTVAAILEAMTRSAPSGN
jgi:CubicO group peptidase (beta-lactamase class C family)